MINKDLPMQFKNWKNNWKKPDKIYLIQEEREMITSFNCNS